MIENLAFNIVAIAVSLVSMLGYNYHAYYFSLRSIFMIQTSDAKLKSQLARNWSAASLWMQKHAEKDDAPSVTLAVQTFRNTILVSTFVGSITFQAAITTITSYPLSGDEIAKTRIMILSVLLFLSFLSWASAIRCAAYLGYQTGVLSVGGRKNDNDHIKKPPNKEDTNMKQQNTIEMSHLTTATTTTTTTMNNNNQSMANKQQQLQSNQLPISSSSSLSSQEEGLSGNSAMNHDESLSSNTMKPITSSSSSPSPLIIQSPQQIQEQLPLSHRHTNTRTELSGGVYHMHNHEAHMMIVMLLSFSLGFRFLFLAIPFFLYIAGPISLIIFTAFMLIFLYLWDHLFTLDDMSQQPSSSSSSSLSTQIPLMPQYNTRANMTSIPTCNTKTE